MKISFLSGTRADYSKIKPYIEYLLQKNKDKTEIYIFATCMHMLKKYGNTYLEIQKDFSKDCHIVLDKSFVESNTSCEFAHIMQKYNDHLRKDSIDFVFVHGDRPEALAGAITTRLNNIPLCQIEAGDLSGSIDDSIRHAITKLAHRLLVTDKSAKNVLLAQGENKKNIFIVGNSSLANKITPENHIREKYNIPFDKYAILIYHPVTTTAPNIIKAEIKGLMKCLKESGLNFVVIMPNNDLNSQIILDEYKKYESDSQFCFFKSLPLNIFINLLKKSLFLIGNSSCGIKEAPHYHVPVFDIGERQKNRYLSLFSSKQFYHLNSLNKLPELIKKFKYKSPKRKEVNYRKSFFKKLDSVFDKDFWYPKIQK